MKKNSHKNRNQPYTPTVFNTMPNLINRQSGNMRTTPPRNGKKASTPAASARKRKSGTSPPRRVKTPNKKQPKKLAKKKRGSDRVHFEPSIHLKVLQKEVAKERKRRRELNLPEEAVNLPVSIKQSFFRLSDKNEPIRTGKWLSDLCARSKRSDNNTTHETLTVLHTMGVDVGKAIYSRENNEQINKHKKVRDARQYDKWFMGNYAKLNMWISQGGGENDIHNIDDTCTDDDLKKFVKKMLKAYDEGNLDQKYVNMMDAMSFPWRPFNESFQILCSYYMENGNMEMNEEDNPQLFRFAVNMRKLKADKKISKVEEAMLSNIGFPWVASEVMGKEKETSRGNWTLRKERGESRSRRQNGSRVISVTSPTEKRLALSTAFGSFSGAASGKTSNIAFDNDSAYSSVLDKEERNLISRTTMNINSSIDESRIKLGNSSSQLMKDGSFLSSSEEDDESDIPFGSNGKNNDSVANGISSSSSFEGEDEVNSEVYDEDSASDEDESEENGGKNHQGKDFSYISEEGSGNERDADIEDSGEPFVLTFDPQQGFQSRICSYCKKEQTRHHCHRASDTGLMIYEGTRVCGKSICHVCKLKEGYESTACCIDCYRKEVEEKKKKKAEEEAKAKVGAEGEADKTKAKAKVKYTMDMLKKMDTGEVRSLCTKEGIEFGQKRLPGCLKLLKAHFKLSS